MKKGNKSLAKNAVLNGIKQCCVILFPLIVFPYVSRILGADNYGKVSFATSIITYITLIAGLGIKNYAIREGARIRDHAEELDRFSCQVFTINIISTIFAYLCLILLFLFWPKLKNYKELILILSIGAIFTTLGTDWINVIFEDYRYITIRYITCHIISIICIFLIVREKNDYVVYALISISAEVLANILNIFHIRKLGLRLRLNFDKSIITHIQPILLIFGTAVATRIYVNSDITILGVFCSDSIVGNYSVAAKIYSLVKQLVNALMIVAIPRISHMLAIQNQQKVKNQLSRILETTFLTVIPASFGLFMLREEVVYLLSGYEYRFAVQPLAILSFSLICASLSCFFVNVVMLPNKMEKQIFRITSISALTNIVLNFVMIPLIGINAAAITTLISEGIILVISAAVSRKYYEIRVKPIISSLITCIIITAVCIIMRYFIRSILLRLLASFIISVMLFAVVVLLSYRQEIRTAFLSGKSV